MRVGLIGAGAIALRHLDVLAPRDDVVVAAICDLDLARAREVASPHGAEAYERWQTMLDGAALDALFVCTPPLAHAEPVVEALARDMPVYVEKPLARSEDDGLAIVAAWEASAAVCAVGYQWRSLDVLGRLRSVLAGIAPGMLVSRSFGPTEGGRGDHATAEAGTRAAWFTDPILSGGILFELGSHDIDLQIAIAGPVREVQAQAASGLLALADAPEGSLRDAVTMLLRFESGALGAIHVAWTDAQLPPVYSLDVQSHEVALELVLDPVFRLHGRAGGGTIEATAATDPRISSVDRFLDAVRSGDRRVPCSPADALHTLRVALACEQAIESGETVVPNAV
jgi:myo-inositol 2-dehydrogenase / D-chiro-inositol 1-dehydrogenase